jgi:hypothetical protein
MKKLKNEHAIFKAALLAAVNYAEGRGAVEFEPTDSASLKLLYVYRLLVHDRSSSPCLRSRWPKAACDIAWSCGTCASCPPTTRC